MNGERNEEDVAHVIANIVRIMLSRPIVVRQLNVHRQQQSRHESMYISPEFS